eukprot:g1140.t1
MPLVGNHLKHRYCNLYLSSVLIHCLQGLQQPATDYSRLKSGDNTLILICKPRWVCGTRVIGGIKCGRKHLFFKRERDFVEVESICVLDFYVHERFQRQGFGYKLFQKFLKTMNEDPSTIAYDRPTSKMSAFLMKYYGCPQLVYSHLAQNCSSLQYSRGTTRSIHHNSNFAVFESFLENAKLRRVRLPAKRSLRNPRSSPQTLSNHPSPIKEKSRPSSTSTRGSYISSTSSSLPSTSRLRQKVTDEDSVKTLLKRLPGRLIDLPTKDSVVSKLRKAPLGPYPGFELKTTVDTVTEANLTSENQLVDNEPNALTRLSLVELPFQGSSSTKIPPCAPPQSMNHPVLSKDFIEGKLNTVSSSSGVSCPQPGPSRHAARYFHRRQSEASSGVKSCLQWNQN